MATFQPDADIRVSSKFYVRFRAKKLRTSPPEQNGYTWLYGFNYVPHCDLSSHLPQPTRNSAVGLLLNATLFQALRHFFHSQHLNAVRSTWSLHNKIRPLLYVWYRLGRKSTEHTFISYCIQLCFLNTINYVTETYGRMITRDEFGRIQKEVVVSSAKIISHHFPKPIFQGVTYSTTSIDLI